MAMSVVDDWNYNPIKITSTQKVNTISDIPFPTVTICPMIKTNKSKMDLNPLFAGSMKLSETKYQSEMNKYKRI